MSDLYETLHKLTEHLKATLPAEPSDAQTALLEAAKTLRYRLQGIDITARRAQDLGADIGELLNDREALQELLAGDRPGRALLLHGLDALVCHVESMASFITAG